MKIFTKEYDGESMIDIPEDMGNFFDPDYNDALVDKIPQDEYGLFEGKFIVTVTWVPK